MLAWTRLQNMINSFNKKDLTFMKWNYNVKTRFGVEYMYFSSLTSPWISMLFCCCLLLSGVVDTFCCGTLWEIDIWPEKSQEQLPKRLVNSRPSGCGWSVQYVPHFPLLLPGLDFVMFVKIKLSMGALSIMIIINYYFGKSFLFVFGSALKCCVLFRITMYLLLLR